jgi:hypothetical protein
MESKIYSVCRYLVALIIISYGFAKLNGSQFTILDSELDKPMGQVPGFWLTWYYFGYSNYGNIIAIIQIISGLLLMFRKTTLLASIIIFGMMFNIVLIDIFYQINLSGLLSAIITLILTFIILLSHKSDIIKFLSSKHNGLSFFTKESKYINFSRNLIRILIVFGAFSFTYWTAHVNNVFPTSIDGSWEIIKSSQDVKQDERKLTHIYFEKNRAFLCVFRYENVWHNHHFEVDESFDTITISEFWLHPKDDEIIFRGKFIETGNILKLDGKLKNGQPVTLELRKK